MSTTLVPRRVAPLWPRRLRGWAKYGPWLAVAAYAGGMLVGTHVPPDSVPRLAIALPDKLLHFAAYFGLALLALLAPLAAPWVGMAEPPRRFTRRAVAVLALCGLIDELTQPLSGRCCDPFDWAADLAGIVAAAVVAALLARLASRVLGRMLTAA